MTSSGLGGGEFPSHRGMLWLADSSHRAFLLGLTKRKEPSASQLILPLCGARETGLLGAGCVFEKPCLA